MRTGIFGGSFDPPHIGHIKMALEARNALKLDRVIFVPTGKAPHKNTILASASDRVNMVSEICEEYGFELSTFEAFKNENCYTADLLEHFKKENPKDEIFLIIGGDSLDYMDKWYMPERIFPLCTVAVIRRKGARDEKAELLREKFGAKIEFINCDYLDFSSTKVRKAISNNEDFEKYILSKTAEYIKKNNLYR